MLKYFKLRYVNVARSALFSTVPTEYRAPKLEVEPYTNKFVRPFSKDMILNIFNLDLMEYPELSNNDDLNRVNNLSNKLETIMQSSRETNSVYEVNKHLTRSGLLGLCVPKLYNGNDYNYMMMCRILESFSDNIPYALDVLNEQILATQAILLAGRQSQQSEYLTGLSTGNVKAIVSIQESLCDDIRVHRIKTTARLNEQEQMYVINGCKSRITGMSTDINLIIVFAKISELEVVPFIVDVGMPGVSCTKCDDSQSSYYNLQFKNVKVPVSNMLDRMSGVTLARKLLAINNVSIAALCSGALRKLLKKTNDFVCSKSIFGKQLSQFEVMQFHLSNFTDKVYSTESVAFYTAGLLDQYPINDLYTESCLTKITSLEALSNSIDLCLKIMGTSALATSDSEFLHTCNNAQILLSNQVPVLETKGSIISESIIHIISTIDAPKSWNYILSEKIGLLKTKAVLENSIIASSFKYNLHQRVGNFADELYDDLHKMTKLIVKIARNSDEEYLLNEEIFQQKIADILWRLYSIVAVLSRSSRSIAIGLRNHDHEVNLAEFHVKYKILEIRKEIAELHQYPKSINIFSQTAKKLKETGGYFNSEKIKYLI